MTKGGDILKQRLELIRRQTKLAVEPKTEQALVSRLVTYMRNQYPDVAYRVDFAGLNSSSKDKDGDKTASVQAKLLKSVNFAKGWPDFEIFKPVGEYNGLHLEFKKAGTRLKLKSDSKVKAILYYKKVRGVGRVAIRENRKRKAGDYATLHLEEQAERIAYLRTVGRAAGFVIGLEETLTAVEAYLNDWPMMLYDVLYK